MRAKTGYRLPVLLDGDVEARELALRRLHHQVELARLADVFIRLAELHRGTGLPSRPEPCRGAGDHDQEEEERKKLRESTHLLMMTSGGGGYKVRTIQRGNIFQFPPSPKASGASRLEPVSSRGQDTWFSATGPGFESP